MLELFLITWMSPLLSFWRSLLVYLQTIRMALLYHPGHPGTDCVFMEEFSQFIEILSMCRKKLVICGDFNYWLDNPSLNHILMNL